MEPPVLHPPSPPPSAPSAPSAVSRGGGGGGGGGGVTPGEFGGTIGDGDQVILYEVAWDKCEERIMRIVAGPPGPGMSVKVISSLVGLLKVNLAQDQPFTAASVFEVVLDPNETFVRVQIEGVIGREASLAQRSIDLRECEGSIGFYSEPEEPIEPTIEEAPFPSTTPMIPQGSMFETTYVDIDFGISYLMEEGSIRQMTVNEESISVTFRLDGVKEGEIMISLSRGLISALDEEFVVLVTGFQQEMEYEVVESTGEYVTLKMTLAEGTEELTIVGTNVVPEFGIMAIAILVVSILGIVVVTRKHRLGFEKF